MRRPVAVLFAFTFAPLVFALSGRPISDLRFDYQDGSVVRSAASDGDDFLVITEEWRIAVRGQIIHKGVPAGPPFFIGDAGDALSASTVWTGSAYVVSWSHDGAIYAATVARGGGLLTSPRLVATGGSPTRVVTNGQRLLVTAPAGLVGIVGALLDLDGKPVGGPLLIWPSSYGIQYDVAGAGNGFAMLVITWNDARVLRLDADARPVTAGATLVDGPYTGRSDGYHSTSGSIAGQGDNAVVLLTAGTYLISAEVKSAVVGPQGEIVRPARTIVTQPNTRGVTLTALAWDGSAFTAAVSSDLDLTGNYHDVRPSLMRVDASGNLVDGISFLSSDSARQFATAAAISGRETLVTFGSSYVLVPRAATTATAPAALARLLNPHGKVVVNSMGDAYLAAWTELDSGGWSVRASRIDRNGNSLDGAGVFLGRPLPLQNQYDYYGLSIDNDGANWLVVWGDYARSYGARISGEGCLLDPTPIGINTGRDVAVRWTGQSLLIAGVNDGSLYTATVSGDGVAAAARLFASRDSLFPVSPGNVVHFWGAPAIAFDGRRCLLVALKHGTFATEQTSVDEISVVGFPVDLSGAASGDSFEIAPDAWGTPPVVASDGTRFVVSYQYVRPFAAILSSPPVIVPLDEAAASGLAITSDGSGFTIALTDANGITTERMSPAGLLSDRRRLALDAASMPGSPSIAASASAPPMLSYLVRDAAAERRTRAAALFISELDANVPMPSAPGAPRASRIDADRIRVLWSATSTPVLGYSIEVRASDGGFRQLGVAPGGATSAVVPLFGVPATAVRIRAWNTGGFSEPSAEAMIATGRVRAVGR
jgi:hypothetical protein